MVEYPNLIKIDVQLLFQSHNLYLRVSSTPISFMIQLMNLAMSMISGIFTGSDFVAKSDSIYDSEWYRFP
jgi:hypothetical protein